MAKNIALNENSYGSDLIVALLKQHGIDYVACNPGATFRGIHDSIVNTKQGESPELIVCCHEEISVAIAHGYAKATGKYMAVLVHSNVGLQHASMAVFNAWCDRVPVIVIGGVGPLASERRRPWIDWIHTSNHQVSVIQDFVKWHDQPFSLASIPESLHRACQLADSEPKAPVYVGVDASFQELPINDAAITLVDNAFAPPALPQINDEDLERVVALLINAKMPVIIADYMGRNPQAVSELIKLAEKLAIPVIDRHGHYNFPNTHPLCLTDVDKEFFSQIDMVLALDVQDLYGALHVKNVDGDYEYVVSEDVPLVHITMSHHLTSSWAADYQKLMRLDQQVAADCALSLAKLNQALDEEHLAIQNTVITPRREFVRNMHLALRERWQSEAIASQQESPLAVPAVIKEIADAVEGKDWMLTNNSSLPIAAWVTKLWGLSKAGCHIGSSGGAGLGYGLGASIGAALAYKGSGKLCINLQADGDLLFTPSALWTAAHHKVPLLTIVMNNRAYNNSREHAINIAQMRGHQQADIASGTELNNPHVDFPALAASYGVKSYPTIYQLTDIKAIIEQAITYIESEQMPALIDIVMQ